MNAFCDRIPTSKTTSKFLCLLIISISLSFLSCLPKPAKADLVDDICAPPKYDRKFCIKAFRSDPRSKGADLLKLAAIGIGLGKSYTKSAMALIKKLDSKEKNPVVKSIYRDCLKMGYEGTLEDINTCSGDLEKKDYVSVGVHATRSLAGPSDCDDFFRDGDVPVPEPKELEKASVQVQELIAALIVIARKLHKTRT